MPWCCYQYSFKVLDMHACWIRVYRTNININVTNFKLSAITVTLPESVVKYALSQACWCMRSQLIGVYLSELTEQLILCYSSQCQFWPMKTQEHRRRRRSRSDQSSRCFTVAMDTHRCKGVGEGSRGFVMQNYSLSHGERIAPLVYVSEKNHFYW